MDNVKNILKLAGEFIKSNFAYLVWFMLYVLLFSILTRGLILVFYMITVLIAFSESAEEIWRFVLGVRPLRLNKEKERLLPLFKEVYLGAVKANPKLSKGIKLYIREDMSINAFAFGKSTLVLTRGSIELLNDNQLKGLMAHEFGHFSYKHTEALLLFTVANLPMSFIVQKLTDAKNYFDKEKRRSFLLGSLCNFFYYIFKGIDFIARLILMHSSRKDEYRADKFAIKSGFGEDLTEVLLEIYSVSISKPESIKEQMNSTHPHITKRIERLERSHM